MMLPGTTSPEDQDRRRRILETVLHRLRHIPAEQIQMKDVAHDSGVALATLYRRFPAKTQLLAAALEHWNVVMTQRFQGQRRPDPAWTPQQRAVDLYVRQLRAYESRPHYARLEVELHTLVDDVVIASLDGRAAANRLLFFNTVPELRPEDARIAANVIGSTLFNAMALWTTGRITFGNALRNVEDAVRLAVPDPLSPAG